jgi:hypothetical protein
VTVTGVSIQKVTMGKTKTDAINVQFSNPVNAGSADNIAAYALATTPQGKKHTTKTVALGRAIYNAATDSVMLYPKKPPLSLSTPLILSINGSNLIDVLGRQIDGKHNGHPGGSYQAMLTKAGTITISALRTGQAHPLGRPALRVFRQPS